MRTPDSPFPSIDRRVIRCRRCPRLVAWREAAARNKVRRFAECKYWGKPVPSFGDPRAQLLIVGLAPAAHGGNRTGRMFTGDRSGDWLYRALHRAGFANQDISVDRNDGMLLRNCYITATCRCAPPQNKLLPEELRACRPFLLEELRALRRLRVIVALGRIAFDASVDATRELGWHDLRRRPLFAHGTVVRFSETLVLIGSYHPSQQNTFTGRLTEPMLDGVFRLSKTSLGNS